MKKHYVVLLTDGYYEAANKKDAAAFLQETVGAIEIIYTRSQDGNYYHDNYSSI